MRVIALWLSTVGVDLLMPNVSMPATAHVVLFVIAFIASLELK